MENTLHKGYNELQKGIDLLISKFGISKSVRIIKQLSGDTTFQENKHQKVELLTTFIISESQQIFGWKDPAAKICNDRDYKEGRMACYHVFKMYTDLSYRQMGTHFKQGKRGALYHATKCEELLSIPNYHKSFVKKYRLLEENTIRFIATINKIT